ncbi:hypothetical protein BSKO_04958 [Bryopsis sp. KO-2023]|nr:hypothetical protein BSKO_04958 [Bryopsis sp. KO-2023]
MDSRLAGVSIPPVDEAPNRNRAQPPPRFLTSPGSPHRKSVKFNITQSRDVDAKNFPEEKAQTRVSPDWDADLEAGLNLLRAADGFAELDTKPPSEVSIDDGSTIEPLPKPFPGVKPVDRHDVTMKKASINGQGHEFSDLIGMKESPLSGDPLEKERVLMAKRFQEQCCEIDELEQLEGLARAVRGLDMQQRKGPSNESNSGDGQKQGEGNLVDVNSEPTNSISAERRQTDKGLPCKGGKISDREQRVDNGAGETDVVGDGEDNSACQTWKPLSQPSTTPSTGAPVLNDQSNLTKSVPIQVNRSNNYFDDVHGGVQPRSGKTVLADPVSWRGNQSLTGEAIGPTSVIANPSQQKVSPRSPRHLPSKAELQSDCVAPPYVRRDDNPPALHLESALAGQSTPPEKPGPSPCHPSISIVTWPTAERKASQKPPSLRKIEVRENVVDPDRHDSSQGKCDNEEGQKVCAEVNLTVAGAFELLGIDGGLLDQQGLSCSFKRAETCSIDKGGTTDANCEEQYLPTRRQRIRAIQVIMRAKSNLQRHRVMEVMERVADIQEQLNEQRSGVERNPQPPPPKRQNKNSQEQKAAWFGATLQCGSRNLLGQTRDSKKPKSGVTARCNKRLATGGATEWEGSKFKIALLESMQGKLMLRLGMLILRHNWEWRRDLSALIETVEEIRRRQVLRGCLGGLVALVHLARENQEKCRRQFLMRLKVRIRSALQFWRAVAHHRSIMEQKVSIGLHAHHRLLKISAMSHWALMMASSKESELQKAVAKQWKSLRKKASVWCAWRKASFKSGIVRAKLAGGNWEADIKTAPPKEFVSLWRGVCARTVNRAPLVSLSCKKRHLLSHIRFSTTNRDVQWAKETAGMDAAKCAVHRAFVEARAEGGMCGTRPGGGAESPSLFLGHWENDSRLEKQVWRHEQAKRDTEEAWLALGRAQDEAAGRKANFEHAIQRKEELVKTASEKVASIHEQEEELLTKLLTLEQEQRSAQVDLHYSKTDLACANERIAGLKAGLQDSMAEELLSKHGIEELEEKLLSAQATENETTLKVKERKKSVILHAKKEKELRAKMTDAETRHLRAKEKYQLSKEQVKCLSENLSRARHFDDRKSATALAKARNDIVRAEERCTASRKEYEAWKSKVDALTCETREAEAVLKADLDRESSQKQKVAELQKRIEAAMKEHSALLEEKTKMRLELKSRIEEKTRVEDRIPKIESVVVELGRRVQGRQEALSSIRSAKEKAVKDEKYSLQALEKLRASMSSEIASLDAEVESRLLDVEDCTAHTAASKTPLFGKPDLLIRSASSLAEHHRAEAHSPDMQSALLAGKMDVLLSTSCSSEGSQEDLVRHADGCTHVIHAESSSSDAGASSFCGVHLDCMVRCVDDAALLMHARVLAVKAFEILKSNVEEARKHARKADMMYRIPLLRRYILDWRAAVKFEMESCYNIWAVSMMKKGWKAWWGWHVRLVWKFEKQRELEGRLDYLRRKNCFQILRSHAEKCSFRRAALDASVTLKKMRVFVKWRGYSSQRAHFQARLDIALEKVKLKNLSNKFAHWRKLVLDKMLLTRVFCRAENAWDEMGGENRHIEEYHLLSSIFVSWHAHAEEETSLHRLAEAEQIALTHSKTNALLRSFQAWQNFIERLEQERFAIDHRNVLFYRWRQRAKEATGNPISLVSIRQKLKRAGFPSERHVLQKSLLCRAMSGWQRSQRIAQQHYKRQMLAKGIAGIRSEIMMADACVMRFFLEWKAPRAKNKAFLAWRAVTKVQTRRRDSLDQAFKHYENYLVRRSMRGWKRVYCMGHERRCRMEAAVVHYDDRLMQMALFCWQQAVERARLIEGHRAVTLMGKGMDGFRTNCRENVDGRVMDYITNREGGSVKRVMESNRRCTSWEAPIDPEPVRVNQCPANPVLDDHVYVPSFLTLRKSPQQDQLLTKSFGAWKLGKRRQPRIPRRRHHPLITISQDPQICQSDASFRDASAQVPNKTGANWHETLIPSRFQHLREMGCAGDEKNMVDGQYWMGPYEFSPRNWHLLQDAGVDPRTVQCLTDLRKERDVFR